MKTLDDRILFYAWLISTLLNAMMSIFNYAVGNYTSLVMTLSLFVVASPVTVYYYRKMK